MYSAQDIPALWPAFESRAGDPLFLVARCARLKIEFSELRTFVSEMIRPTTAITPARGPATNDVPLLRPPPWVFARLAPQRVESDTIDGISVHTAKGLSLVSVRINDAADHADQFFRRATIDAYAALFDKLDRLPARYPVRFWNFLPSIHQDMGGRRDRYMVFNEGRFAAFEWRFGGRDAFDENVATASAVGHGGRDLVIHCLAADRPGRHVGNPRQVTPFCYSTRYGPRPPCFARATVISLVDSPPSILVGGTASILGEDSRHAEDLAAQTNETLSNLSSLIESITLMQDPLSRFTELRVYHPRPADASWLLQHVRSQFPNVLEPELVRADLCRSELLVEIEGVARLDGPA